MSFLELAKKGEPRGAYPYRHRDFFTLALLTLGEILGIIKLQISNIDMLLKGTAIMTVTKNSVIGDVLDFDVETAEFFFAIGMHCLGCPASRGETIEEACAVHGTDADALVEKLNKFLAPKGRGE